MMKTWRFRIGTLFLAVAFLSVTVHADPVVQMTVGPMMGATNMNLMGGVDNGDNSYDFDGTTSMMGMWSLEYDMTVDQDPFVNANFTFQNMSGMTQSFILNVTLPITPTVVPSSLIGGSTGGSFNDANNNGIASVGTVGMGSPMYSGEIDGVGVLPIYPDPTSFSATFAGETVTIPAVNQGLPGPTIPGPAAYSSIGITHKFTLTPGDTVAFTSFFVVEPIPEPSSIAMIGLVSGGIFFIRRKFIQ
ncbi:MAG: PEP-CTERM sorting domain-containing protein [Verrucomicrobiota bacterium]